jgi:hypothetical protein
LRSLDFLSWPRRSVVCNIHATASPGLCRTAQGPPDTRNRSSGPGLIAQRTGRSWLWPALTWLCHRVTIETPGACQSIFRW